MAGLQGMLLLHRNKSPLHFRVEEQEGGRKIVMVNREGVPDMNGSCNLSFLIVARDAIP